jgi:hypothetical protein
VTKQLHATLPRDRARNAGQIELQSLRIDEIRLSAHHLVQRVDYFKYRHNQFPAIDRGEQAA